MYTPFTDISGEKYGKLKVLRLAYMHENKSGRRQSVWVCECDCGNVTNVRRSNLTTGNTVSCGCHIAAKLKNGLNKGNGRYNGLSIKEHVLYNRWLGMCHYGTVCEEWSNFENFYAFAKNLGFMDTDKLKRSDVNKPWSPENCLLVRKNT